MRNQCIAVVEDDEAILDIVELLLTDEGYQVITAETELDLDSLPTLPDLIILDNWLGLKSGHDICISLKHNPATSEIPVILMSAVNDLESIAADCKADMYISKPFDIKEFLDAVNNILS
jgi:DNA-binding response OmpR family regulator